MNVKKNHAVFKNLLKLNPPEYTYKKPKLIPGKADAEKQKVFLEEYEKLKKERKEGEEILFMDGVHPQHNSREFSLKRFDRI